MPENSNEGRPRGRQGEAAENDRRVLEAAMKVLIANPKAPVTAIAAEAGVGVASLYRRFSGREELARQLAIHAMGEIELTAAKALTRVEADPWGAFTLFLSEALEVGAGSLSAFAGTFAAGDAANAAGRSMYERIDQLLTRSQQAGAVRSDMTAPDVLQLFEMLRAAHAGTPDRDATLRRRYIAMLSPALKPQDHSITEAPPTWYEVLQLWNP